MDFNEDVISKIGLPESNNLKYEALLPSSASIGRLISAFSNTSGGTLILGVLNKNGRITITGLSSDFQVDVILKNALSKMSPQPRIHSGIIDYKDKKLFGIKVEKSSIEISFSGKSYEIKSKDIYEIVKQTPLETLGHTMNTNVYLDKILDYLVANPTKINVNAHTVSEIIFKKSISVREGEELISKLRDSGYVKSYGSRFIGISVDTKSFLNAGGFSKGYSNETIKKVNKSIFISYNWNHKSSANKLFDFLSAKDYDVSIDDHKLEYKDSISTFMETIRLADFAVLIISDEYLKSENCMIEVLHVLKDRNALNKILPIRHADVQIFKSSDRMKYVEFWKSQVEQTEELLAGIDPITAIEEIKRLKHTRRIYEDIADFLAHVADMITSTIEEQEKTFYKSITDFIEKIN